MADKRRTQIFGIGVLAVVLAVSAIQDNGAEDEGGASANSAALFETPSAYGYPSVNRPGDQEFRDIGAIAPSEALITEIMNTSPEVTDVTLYCAAHPGPRFAGIDGRFYALNGKARRDGAYVITNSGRESVFDAIETPSPLADELGLVTDMIGEALGACS